MTATRATHLRRLLAVVVGLTVASVTLSGCLFTPIQFGKNSASPSHGPDTSGVSADLKPFYAQTVVWRACNGGDECSRISVPLDWNAPSRGKAQLAVIRHRATDGSAQGALLVNPGGPGASGVQLIRDSVEYAVGSDLEKHYDVIGFDPRGVGGSTPAVRCYDATDMDSFLFDLPTQKRNTPAWVAEELSNFKQFGQACDRNSAGILSHIDTVSAARDMDVIRAVLGQKKLDYLGYSYGTFLGATYAGLYPNRVGHMVLDGALDPSVSALDVSVAQGIGFESALKAYMAYCLRQKGCPFTGTVADGMSDLGAMLAQVDADPLPNSDGRQLGADSLMTAIVSALYAQSSWKYLTQALDGVANGDPSIAFQLADFYYNRVDGRYEDNSFEAFNAYNCMDYPSGETAGQIAAAQQQLKQKAPTIAPYWSVQVDTCAEWPVKTAVTRQQIHASGAGPIVVIGTSNDPATPYAWAKSLASQLDSGVLITRIGQGHTGFNKGNSCVDDAVNGYFLNGTTPQNGLVCR
ncbi:MAG TPA: alpha/beta hydrolase [Microbacterium sp.]|uniref:alpha/beta hydrolase n=1 Tax=Microbacterium sp. TaxID=51671 RepID=UPI002B4A23B1|nr:alpha/beta hydrolase [Microbacterium sp.]HKT57951.1 alpha/beta hydrolase [Microbacterium sp.]